MSAAELRLRSSAYLSKKIPILRRMKWKQKTKTKAAAKTILLFGFGANRYTAAVDAVFCFFSPCKLLME